ncbi:MAG: hypothetical protein ACTH58_10955 [Marinomonas foliarum]|uniref:hypothetical protein n=1 Tax=Marinomonas foliarum TaxID=491950 RepID=UPI003F9DDEF7
MRINKMLGQHGMFIVLLKIIVAIYGATKLIAAKDPAKSFFDLIDFKINGFLFSLKNQPVKQVLLKASKTLFWVNVLLFLIFFLAAIFFKPLPKEFVLNWSLIFISTLLINVSIPWNLDHSSVIKKYVLNSPLLLIPATPILSLGLELFYKIDFLSVFLSIPPIQELYELLEGNRWYLAVSLSLIFFVVYIVIPYVQFWIILLPVFYIFLGLTYSMQLLLGIIHKHLNENLLAVIMGILVIILAGM